MDDIFIKIFLALVLGGVLGLERQYHDKPAGFATNCLICLGAMLFTVLSEFAGTQGSDPGRIAAQIVTGVGFIGAGAILRDGNKISGLTTAAGIWMVAAIGLAVGAGMYIVSLIATALVLFILVSLEQYDRKRVGAGGQTRVINIEIEGIVQSFHSIDGILDSHGVKIQDRFIKYDFKQQVSCVALMVFTKGKMDYAPVFNEISRVMPVHTITLSNDINI